MKTESVGKKIRELRIERKWSQEELGRQSGVSLMTISAIERGREPNTATVRKLAAALGVPAGELLG